MAHIQLITFDLDNTLWPVDDVIHRAEALGSKWLTSHFPEHQSELSATRMREARLQLLAASPDYRHNMSALRRDSILQTLTSIGVPVSQAKALADDTFDIFLDARNQVTFFPGVIETLEKLAEHRPLGAITNGNADLEKIGIRHHFVFHHSAESVGRGKPDPRIFQAGLASARCDARHALHIGDHPLEDIQAARDLGFSTAWANFLSARWPESVARADADILVFTDIPDLPLLQD